MSEASITIVPQKCAGDRVEDIQSAYGRPPPHQAEASASCSSAHPPKEKKPARLTPTADRTFNMEALTLAFVAETNIALSSVPKLIEFAKVSNTIFLSLRLSLSLSLSVHGFKDLRYFI